MNFKQHQEDIKRLVSRGADGRGRFTAWKGVYVFSREANDKAQKIGVAYGTQGVYSRVKHYKICYPYPDEFYLHMLILTDDEPSARLLERKILNDKQIG